MTCGISDPTMQIIDLLRSINDIGYVSEERSGSLENPPDDRPLRTGPLVSLVEQCSRAILLSHVASKQGE